MFGAPDRGALRFPVSRRGLEEKGADLDSVPGTPASDVQDFLERHLALQHSFPTSLRLAAMKSSRAPAGQKR